MPRQDEWTMNTEVITQDRDVAQSWSMTSGDQVSPSNLTTPPKLSYLNLPADTAITIYAQVPNARSMEVVQSGDDTYTFVGNRSEDNVYVVIDLWSNNVVDEVRKIASGLNSPNGVAYLSGDLYVSEVDRILIFRDILNRLDAPAYEVLFDQLPNDAQHGWKYLAFWPDGELYIPIGAPCNNCLSDAPYASLYRLDLETKKLTMVAQGIRNTVGFARHPETQELWFTDNGRDRMWDDIPTDELNHVTQEGQHYGYPYCHAWDVQDDEFIGRDCSEFVPPVAQLGPHVAALGMIFADTAKLWAERDNHVLIAEHGSWNRSDKIGYQISAVDLSTNEYKVFIDGRLQPGEKVLGRPVDLAVLPDGSILMSDDDQGLIYRIQYNGK